MDDHLAQPDVKPEHTRAGVWMAIIRGATAIAFTHKWLIGRHEELSSR
jgi:hypothetical protein